MTSDVQNIIKDVWDNAEDETYRAEMSHWLGVGKWAGPGGERAFHNIGSVILADFKQFLRMIDHEMPASPTVIEWGPGGGSNLLAWRDVAAHYVGVDISGRNLNEAERVLNLQEGHKTAFQKVVLEDAPTSIESQLPPVDIILSTAVFQHFPSKEYGAEVLKLMARVAKPNALALIQIRFDNGARPFLPKSIDEYKEKFATATSYKLDEFWDLAVEAGFEPQFVRKINSKNNNATFYLKKI